jgi:hypothetical protein
MEEIKVSPGLSKTAHTDESTNFGTANVNPPSPNEGYSIRNINDKAASSSYQPNSSANIISKEIMGQH